MGQAGEAADTARIIYTYKNRYTRKLFMQAYFALAFRLNNGINV